MRCSSPLVSGVPGFQTAVALLGSVLFGVPVAPATEPEPPSSTIRGRITDTEVEGAPVAGAVVVAMCSCLNGPRSVSTDEEGSFELTDLPAGQYTLVVDRGGPVSRTYVALAPAGTRIVTLAVAPPISTTLDEERRRELARAHTMIVAGSLGIIAAALMFVSARVEGTKPDCNFGLDDCSDRPRPGLATGLGVAGGILTAGGTALIVVGAWKNRRIRARFDLDRQGASVNLTGRF